MKIKIFNLWGLIQLFLHSYESLCSAPIDLNSFQKPVPWLEKKFAYVSTCTHIMVFNLRCANPASAFCSFVLVKIQRKHRYVSRSELKITLFSEYFVTK